MHDIPLKQWYAQTLDLHQNTVQRSTVLFEHQARQTPVRGSEQYIIIGYKLTSSKSNTRAVEYTARARETRA